MVKVFSLLVGTILMLSANAAWAEEMVFNRILVKINDSIITQYDLDEEMKPILDQIKGRQLSESEQKQLAAYRKQALENMVNDVLIQQEVVKYGINITDDIIDQEIARVREEQGMTEEEFEDTVKADGITMDDFRVRLKKLLQKQELLGHTVHSKVLVTDSEIKEEYDARSDDYTLEKMIDLAIILLPSEISAVEVKKRIEDGQMTFAEAVTKYSVGPGKDEGGSIGELNYADLAEEWREALQGVEEGGITDPLSIQGKEALLSPVKILENRMVPLKEVRDAIYQELMDKKRETIFSDYFEKLKQSSVIVYMNGSGE